MAYERFHCIIIHSKYLSVSDWVQSLSACTIDSMVDLIGNEVAWAVHTYDGSVEAKPKEHQISRKTSKIIDRAAKTRTICDLEILSSYAK